MLKPLFKPGKPLARINMTPLIDVSLVLVIILLLLTPLAFESGFLVKGAAPTPVKSVADSDSPISLYIASEDSVRVEESLVSRAALSRVLRSLIAGEGRRQVLIACAEDVSHGAFVNVLDQAKLSGAAEIAITEPR